MANSISKWIYGDHYVPWTNEFNYHVERWTDDDLHIEHRPRRPTLSQIA